MICTMALTMLAAVGCKGKKAAEPMTEIEQKVAEYAEFELTSDLIANLSENEKEILKIFIEIGDVMDEIYWDEYFGYENRASLDTLADPAVRAFANIQYGAWDRLDMLYEETERLFKRVKASKDICELRNMINVGYLITRFALERKESRGLHYTIDYPVHAYDKK